MSIRAVATLSVLANVALVAAGLYAGRRSHAAPEEGTPSGEAHATASVLTRTNVERVEVTLTNETAPFHWSEVQAEDLKQFATNLYAIGCPRETVRAVIERELWNQYLPRRRQLIEPFQRDFWNIAASGRNIEKAMNSYDKDIEKLEAETVERLDEIVGEKSEEKPEQNTQRSRQRLDYLSQEKQQALEDLERKFSEAMGKVRPEKGGKWTPELRAKRDELQAQRKAAVRALMSDEEYAEHELRQSRYAHVASNSLGFEATPDEMRQMARIYQQSEAADDRPGKNDPNAETKKAQAAAAKLQREEALKQSFGDERFAQFQQGTSEGFSEVYPITKRYGLSRESAAQAADVLKSRNEALRVLREDKGMPRDERAQRETAVQLETRSALLQALGDRALRTYEKYHGPLVPVPKAPASE